MLMSSSMNILLMFLLSQLNCFCNAPFVLWHTVSWPRILTSLLDNLFSMVCFTVADGCAFHTTIHRMSHVLSSQ
uniref:Secreted protein n=1 Tax=Anopheles darlingi TaxID=43151 RepID=A0A2M4DE48_ANODA